MKRNELLSSRHARPVVLLGHRVEVGLRSSFFWSLELVGRKMTLRTASGFEIVITTDSPKIFNPPGEAKTFGNVAT